MFWGRGYLNLGSSKEPATISWRADSATSGMAAARLNFCWLLRNLWDTHFLKLTHVWGDLGLRDIGSGASRIASCSGLWHSCHQMRGAIPCWGIRQQNLRRLRTWIGNTGRQRLELAQVSEGFIHLGQHISGCGMEGLCCKEEILHRSICSKARSSERTCKTEGRGAGDCPFPLSSPTSIPGTCHLRCRHPSRQHHHRSRPVGLWRTACEKPSSGSLDIPLGSVFQGPGDMLTLAVSFSSSSFSRLSCVETRPTGAGSDPRWRSPAPTS